jgi:hypothetical protein
MDGIALIWVETIETDGLAAGWIRSRWAGRMRSGWAGRLLSGDDLDGLT